MLGNEFIHTHILSNLTLRINILESQTIYTCLSFKDTHLYFDTVDLHISQSTDPVPTLRVSELKLRPVDLSHQQSTDKTLC